MIAVLRWLLPLQLSLAALVMWVWLYLRYGQEHMPEPCPDTLANPPYDWTPAQVSFLCNWGELCPQDMIATTVDLACRGAINLDAEPVSVFKGGGLLGVDQEYRYFVSRNAAHRGELSPSERYLIEQVLMLTAASHARVPLTDLMIEGARNAGDACGRVEHWRTLAQQEPQPVPLDDPISLDKSWAGAAIGVALALLSYPLVILLRSPHSIGLVVVGGALALGSKAIRRRSQEARRAAELRSPAETLSVAGKHTEHTWLR
jgi:hypothetical protein